jgi:mycofactocin system glycosyltransferase
VAGLTRFELDPSCRRPAHGPVLLGGSPLRLFRVTTAGAGVLDAIERGEALDPGHEPLTDALLDAGAIHPLSAPGAGPWTIDDVTVVVPVHDGDHAAVAAIIAACAGVGGLVIVDDASTPPIGRIAGASVVRLDTNAGPGGARLAGLGKVTTPLVAFVDADVTLPAGWLEGLLPHLTDDRVALVAPRVRSQAASGSALARYEAERSPLDLGPQRARVRAGTRVSYVPAAALLCRRAAVIDVGGFDAQLRFGEDVDLVWRLDEAGWRCRYEPDVVVEHEPRPDLGAWLAQRVAYGSSAAPLAGRHPGALAPVRMSGWSLAVWALAALGRPLAAATVAGGTTAALARVLGEVPDRARVAIDVAGRGHLHAGRLLADALRRPWWPLLAAAALVSRRARRLALATLAPLALDWAASGRRLDPARYVALRVADDVAYGAGVWRGVLTARTLAPLVPDLRNWPPRRRQDAAAAGYGRHR